MVEHAAGGRADDLEPDPALGERLLGGTAGRRGHVAAQRLKALAQATPIELQAAHDVDEAARPPQAAAEPDRAQTPAAAEPEERVLAVLLEGLGAEQRLRGVGAEKALEDRARVFFAAVAIDLSCQHFFGQAEREVDGGELVGQKRPVGGGRRLDEHLEVGALVRRRRVGNRRADRLAHAQPVAVQVVDEEPEVARPPAQQPAEHDAAADVQQAPAPAIDVAEQLARLGRQQADRDLFGEELVEDLTGLLDLVLAAGRVRFFFLLERLRILAARQLLFEDRLVRVEQGLQCELEIGVAIIGCSRDRGFGRHLRLSSRMRIRHWHRFGNRRKPGAFEA